MIEPLCTRLVYESRARALRYVDGKECDVHEIHLIYALLSDPRGLASAVFLQLVRQHRKPILDRLRRRALALTFPVSHRLRFLKQIDACLPALYQIKLRQITSLDLFVLLLVPGTFVADFFAPFQVMVDTVECEEMSFYGKPW